MKLNGARQKLRKEYYYLIQIKISFLFVTKSKFISTETIYQCLLIIAQYISYRCKHNVSLQSNDSRQLHRSTYRYVNIFVNIDYSLCICTSVS